MINYSLGIENPSLELHVFDKNNVKTKEQLKSEWDNKQIKNEATPAENIIVNEGVQLGDNQVGEMAVEEKPTAGVVAEEVVQPSDNIGEVERKNE